jgi:exosortase/archaeosortase family protein
MVNIMSELWKGCNAISVIICFHLWSLFGRLQTLLLSLYGSLLIYVLNVLRIAALCTDFLFSKTRAVLHGVLFPCIFIVFMLWLIWVRNF